VDDPAGPGDEIAQQNPFGNRHGERLLYGNILSGEHRRRYGLRVPVIRRADHDGIEVKM
jgi:hypothetical protein